MRGNFFSAGALSRPDARPAGGKFSPLPAAGARPPRSHNRAQEQQEQNNKSRTTRAEQQEQNKSRTRAGQPPARGAGRAQCARPLPPFPLPAGLVAPHARAPSRSHHRPQGGSPTFPPKHSVQRERETIAPAYLISAARRRAAAPRGAPKSHFKCRHHFSLAQISISQPCA